MSLLIPITSAQSFSFANHNSSSKKQFLSIQNPKAFSFSTVTQLSSSFAICNPLRLSIKRGERMVKVKRKGSGRRFGAVCYAGALNTPNLQWIFAISSAVLMLAKGTAIQKSFLVPLFALQAPANVISWIKGEYGIWTAFLALLVRLFSLFLGKKEGAIVGLVIAGYLAFQHFSRMGNLQKAFEQGSIVATLATICIGSLKDNKMSNCLSHDALPNTAVAGKEKYWCDT
ncbi:unnamed protein product [Dovyalis caffra]|uniref:Uncharacterized protein n=1 Tax=Dovyalis caffra TaxID=77055 RepID=A0AAV1SFR0_9ROSI|nr:unnamed protein product [Dovyalis caffra]